ncbi:DUF5365 family protein [Bacillus sp. FJAT-50079]|uniref:DUF5365 family protein n=1 Tax=Bacillus sp. FJAT-50079 TaxID=2833577 RepID=UPI001BC9B97F|nr:DUF5365 family protein [Bacillus sp. FJAT-50079]MBS4210736.1 DUF5365 family protein [Bacillus sp. FJAT-50079]
MKVVYAATCEQERTLANLIEHMYSSVFPHFYSNEEITSFREFGVLQPSVTEAERLYTLKTSFQAMASLQVMICILEKRLDREYERLFERNVHILKNCELFFPFTFQSFYEKAKTNEIVSLDRHPMNQMLI